MRRQEPRSGKGGQSDRRDAVRPGLFRPPSPSLTAEIDKTLALAAGVFAVPARRLGDLPHAVRDLSRLLTAERGTRHQSYWSSPRYVAAYLRYFLPWNLWRLACFLPGLDIPLRSGSRLLDLGSGPLTMPLALWLSRPEARSLELEIVCADTSQNIMERGRDIFLALAGKNSPWRISLLRSTADKALRGQRRGATDLVMAGNVLNEMAGKKDREEGGAVRDAGSFSTGLATCLAPGGRALLLEPGTRLGGALVCLCRRAALDLGLEPLAPCTHAGPCPMLPDAGKGGQLPASPYGRKGQSPSWCHFVLPARNIPPALAGLSAMAGLEKERLSCSFLLLARAGARAGAGAWAGEESQGGPLHLGAQAAGAPDKTGCPGAEPGHALPGRPGERGNALAERPEDGLPDELAELEALYEELQEEDQGRARRAEAGARAPGAAAGRTGAAAIPARAAAKAAPVPSKAAARAGSKADKAAAGQEKPWTVRVLSGPIRLPGREEPARYVCGPMGLGLLLDAGDLFPGAAAGVWALPGKERDLKSGALLLTRSAPRQRF